MSRKEKIPIVTIAQEYYEFTEWSKTKMQLTPSDTFIFGELYIACNDEEMFTLEAQAKYKPTFQYLQAQMDLIFCISNKKKSKIKTKNYITYLTDGVNISMNYPIITRKYIPLSILQQQASSLLVRISINGIDKTNVNGNSIHVDDIEIKASKKEIKSFIARMPHGYAAGYDKMVKQHLQSKNGQVIIPELAEIVKQLVIKQKRNKLFFHLYSSKRKVFDETKCILIPNRQQQRNKKKSKWHQYQSTGTDEINSIAPPTVPNFEPSEEEILYQIEKEENQDLISKWQQENISKPECEFLVMPTIQHQMRMRIIIERENIYYGLKKQHKIKGILKSKNQKSNTKTTKKITFNLTKNTTKICTRWINSQ